MAINTHQADHVEYIQDSNGNKHYLNAEYLDGHSYAEISNAIGGKGTVTSVATADGVTGGPITTSGTIKANLKSYTKNTAEIGGKLYGVELDKNGKLAVNVPWTDTNTDTHLTTGLYIGKANEKSNSATTNGNTYLKLFDNDTKRAQHLINGTGLTTVTSDASGTITINSTLPANLVTTDTEQTVTGTKHFNAITANTIGTGSDANNYFQSQKFRGEGDANTYYHAVDFGYAGHNQVDFYEYGGNYNFYINTQANTDSRQLLFGINPSGIKIPPAAGAKVLGTNAEGQVESHSLGIADISSLQSTLDGKVNSSSLATVAKTGSYNDLSNKPTIPDISNLVPYTGASKDVNLGDHSLLISDKTVVAGGAKIKISGRYQSEDDTSITIEPGNITLAGTGDATTILNKSGFKAQLKRDTNGDGQLDTTYYSMYEYGRIAHNGKRLSFPEKNGTIALTSDLSTLLDKGTSSTVVNQVVYNPVEMKKALTAPSIQGENSANNTSNGAPMYILGGTMANENGQATGSSSLSLFGYTGATGNPYDTTLTQTASGVFRIAPGGNLADTLV